MAEVYGTWTDVQEGFEKPIPASLQPKVDVFLARASRRLRIKKPKLAAALAAAPADSDLAGFVKDMVVDAAERKLRNPGGFSHENAGVFSVSRYDDFAKGRITFDPEDLATLDELIDGTFGSVIRGPVKIGIPAWRRP
ncbi:head-to-tail adaptor [Rhodococcus phage GuyFagieri]|nr:head-to-tail adaptor [Rhodococcus phage GuyFagieri]